MADAKGAYIGGVPVQFKDAAVRAMISDEYNSAETYAKGNLCIYNGKIYEAIKETTGTWDATAWEETTLAKVNSKLNGDIASLTEKRKLIAKEFSSGNISITNNMTYELPYTVPDGYEYLSFLGAESYNVPTSISYQGNIGNAIALYVNCFGNGGNGSINMRLLFQRK